MLKNFSFIISFFNSILWNGPLLFLLCATHLLFTFRLKFPQRYTVHAIKMSVSSPEDKDGKNLSGFATLATTLAATLGTGNIVGVSTAIALGGPGALFWCWITGLFGMATAYAECYLSILFRQKQSDGTHVGGPMYVLEKGLNSKFLGKFYAVCVLCAAIGVGCTTQSSAISDSVGSLWQVSPHIAGTCVALVAGTVILGGIRSISSFCTKVVPVLGFLYIGACFFLLYQDAAFLPKAFHIMMQSAFSSKAVSGGLLGGSFLLAARYGIARGLFTNEAGIGTAAIAAGAAEHSDPVRQGMISMTAVFWDTVVMCALTGLVILTNLLKSPESTKGFSYAGLTGAAFASFPLGGSTFLTISLIAFAIATLIGWCYFGEKGAEYLWGAKGIRAYHVIYILMIYVGAVIPMDLVWNLTDFINGIMILPNVLALWSLRDLIRLPKSS